MFVISKMQVTKVEDYGQSRKIYFSTVYEQKITDNKENHSFTKATPSGEAWMTVDNKAVWPAFLPPQGYLDVERKAAEHYVVYIPANQYSLSDLNLALTHLKHSDANTPLPSEQTPLPSEQTPAT